MYIAEISDGKQIINNTNDLQFDKKYNVVVAGLGSSGALAALYAAENGLSVLGAESFKCIGGTHTIGGIFGHYFGCPGGRYLETNEKVASFFDKYTCTGTEAWKLVVENEMLKAGVDIEYESTVCGVYKEEDTVIGVKLFTKYGFKNIRCDVLFDCTGDAIVAHMAGCLSEYGRKNDGQTQPYSMVSLGYDGTRYRFTNVDFGRVDQRNDRELSDAYIFSRAYEMSEERKNISFVSHMPLIGIREGRRIISEEPITLNNLFMNKFTETPVYYSYADLDKHGWDVAFDGEALGDWAIGANIGAYNVTIPISYKTIIPKGVSGILVPCRGLGVDRDISSAVRMMTDMKKLAEISADMAYLAIKNKCALKDISYDDLKEMLLKSGCLNYEHNRGVCIDGVRDEEGKILPRTKVNFVIEPQLLKDKLATDKPGQAIWSAKLMGAKSAPVLKELLSSDEENTRKHAAFALASIGCEECKSLLREMVEERDNVMLRDCRKHNNFRGCMAIYWLGRLADKEIVDSLIQIITDKDEVLRPVYNSGLLTTRYKISDFNGIYFQFISNSVAALVRIGDKHKGLRNKIAKAFESAFADDSYYEKITTRPQKSSEGNLAVTIKNIAFNAVNRWND